MSVHSCAIKIKNNCIFIFLSTYFDKEISYLNNKNIIMDIASWSYMHQNSVFGQQLLVRAIYFSKQIIVVGFFILNILI